jgi:hypothetical protein
MFQRFPALSVVSTLACAICAHGQVPNFNASAPAKPGEPVRFTFQAPPGVLWAMVFYRAAGEEEFRSLPLRTEANGMVANLPAGEIGGRAIQYYLAFKGGDAVKYLPEGAPGSLASLELAATPGAGAAGSTLKQKVPFHLEASLEQVVYRSQKVEGERTFFSSGQVALGYEVESGEHRMSLNTRVAYQDQPAPGQSHWAVGELRGLYTYQSHRAQIGDMALQESEFTVGGAGRRGLDYLYDNRTLYAHLFAVNTQQLAGFRGLAWPAKGTELFGGALGYAWMEGRVKTKLVFLTGRDDPSQGVNIGAAPFMTRREGSTGAVTLEAALLNSRLSLNGEYARTNYDKDLDDAAGKVQDQAWRIGGAWTEKNYSARGSYRQIGRDFGTLGYPIMEGDRRGADGGFSLSLNPAWSLNASATSERNNPNADPLETRASNDVQSLDARWTPKAGLTLKAGLSHAAQEAGTPMGALVPFANSKRAGFVTGLDWAMGTKGALTFSMQFDKLEGTGASTTTGHSSTLVLGGSFQEPDRVRLAPTFSYSKSTDDLTGLDSKVASAFLNADVTLVRKLLNLALNGGYNRTEAPGMAAMTSTNADAALQYFLTPYLERQVHRGQAVLALRFRYTRVQTLPEADRRASLTLNFSF